MHVTKVLYIRRCLSDIYPTVSCNFGTFSSVYIVLQTAYQRSALLKIVAQLIGHCFSIIQRDNHDMSTLQLEQKHVCSGCMNGEVGLFAEFNGKLLCSQCFKNEIENHVGLASK